MASSHPKQLVLPWNDAIFERAPDGSLLIQNTTDLGFYPATTIERLQHWATVAPERVFLASRGSDRWRHRTFRDALSDVRAIAQALLDRGLSSSRPVMVLSGNGIEHGLLALACLHVGIPYVPVSAAYSLLTADFTRLREIIALVKPALVFADDGDSYGRALVACVPPGVDIVTVSRAAGCRATAFDKLLSTVPTSAVEVASASVTPETVTKLFFTSGSMGSPKAVIHTQRMWCSSMKMAQHCYSRVIDEPPVLVDWLPWSHVSGGIVSFGLALFNGGTLYIDDGKPLPDQIEKTVRNLREVAPSIYLNVPKGYVELIPWLKRDRALRDSFFSRLQILQYTGASIAQHVCDAFDELAREAVGKPIPWLSLFGSTEGGLITAHRHTSKASAGCVGLPPPGVKLKLTPSNGRMEARVQSPGVTPGYWRRDDLTSEAFDEDGFFRTGDALDWADIADRQQGFRHEGRIGEDFKLASGTWVRVGALRATLLEHLTPEVRDVVIAGENRDYLAVLGIPSGPDVVSDPAARTRLLAKLKGLAAQGRGSAQLVWRFAFLTEPLSIDSGELTDKGSISQRGILRRHAASVEGLYAEKPEDQVICIEPVQV